MTIIKSITSRINRYHLLVALWCFALGRVLSYEPPDMNSVSLPCNRAQLRQALKSESATAIRLGNGVYRCSLPNLDMPSGGINLQPGQTVVLSGSIITTTSSTTRLLGRATVGADFSAATASLETMEKFCRQNPRYEFCAALH